MIVILAHTWAQGLGWNLENHQTQKETCLILGDRQIVIINHYPSTTVCYAVTECYTMVPGGDIRWECYAISGLIIKY